MIRKQLLISIVFSLTAAFLSACGGGQQSPPRQPVTYLEVKEGTARITSLLPGRISALHVSEVRPQVGGILKKRLFTEGAIVEEGQALYQIDPALFEASYKSAQATLASAEASYNASKALALRYGNLVKTKAVSRQEYDNAVAQYKSDEATVSTAKAAVDTAKINLEYTTIKAPITGRIGKSSVTEGALLTQNQVTPLATIQQLDSVYMDVSQSSYQVMNMQRTFGKNTKRDVELIFQDGTAYSEKGSLEFYDVTVDQSTDTVNIRIVFPNHDGFLLPGMYAKALITEGVDEHAVLIPQKTITKNQKGEDTVKVLVPYSEKKEGETTNAPSNLYTVTVRVVKASGIVDTNKLYVREGLKPGDIILVDGQQKAAVGSIVQGSPATEESLYGVAAKKISDTATEQGKTPNQSAE